MSVISVFTKHKRATAIVVLNIVLGVYSFLVADFVRRASTSVVTNMYLILGWVALVGAASFLEAAVVRDLVGRGGWRGTTEIRDPSGEPPRPWRDLHLPLTIAIVALFGINMLVFDQIAQGFFIDGQRATYAITRMRSDNEVLQREGIVNASKMMDPRIRRELVVQIEQPGPGRKLATWALGKVGTTHESDVLLRVLRDGEVEERGAAAVALGRLRDDRLANSLADRLQRRDEPLESYLYGLGLLGDRRSLTPIFRLMIDESTAPDHLALSAWVLGQLEEREGCPILVDAVEPTANPLTCAALHSIKRLRCPEVSERLIEAFERSSPEERCDAQRFVDVDGQSFELWPAGLFRFEVLDTLVQCEDEGSIQWLRALSRDGRQVPQIRDLASEMTRNNH